MPRCGESRQEGVRLWTPIAWNCNLVRDLILSGIWGGRYAQAKVDRDCLS